MTTVRNPIDGKVVGEVPTHSAADVAAAADSVRAAQPDWARLGARGRKPWLLAFQNWLFDNSGWIADLVQAETGKTRMDAEIEAPALADVVGYYAIRATKYLADSRPRPHSPLAFTKRLTVTHRPYPLAGVISPWNGPLVLAGLDSVSALAAGCAVLLKPSEVTPLCGTLLTQGWAEIGAPPVFAAVTGGADTGAAVVAQADFVAFTGSAPVGRVIAQAAAARLVPYSLELGGNDPAIVLADADLDRAASGIAWGALFNAGQLCTSVERVYVEEPVYETFVAKLTDTVRGLRQGRDAAGFEFEIGSMIDPAQVDIVRNHIEDAIAGGAKALTGGVVNGSFVEPTVLVDLASNATCLHEETFGPVIPVVKVADENEAVRLANGSDYGLSASVWTKNAKRGRRIADRLDVGAVNINDAIANMFSLAIPMGGWKSSGVGSRMGGAEGLLKFCRTQAVTQPRGPVLKAEPMWFPYSPRKMRAALRVLRVTTARGKRRWR